MAQAPVARRIELDRPRDLSAVLGGAFELFGAHLAVFLTATLVVVAPIVIFVDGVWGHQLADGADAHLRLGATATSLVLSALVIPPLVTSLHVWAVLGLSRGEAPTVAGTLRAALRAFPYVLPVIALYLLVLFGGFLLLLIPGFWLSVRLFFGPQAVVVEGLHGTAALRRSADLVDGQWWRVFSIQLVVGLASTAITNVVVAVIGATVDSGVVYVVVRTLGTAVGLSITALAGTLLFFDLRYRRGLRPAQGGPVAP